MVILHIAAVKNEYTSGVDVVVSQHIRAQGQSENVALVNINNIKVDKVDKQFLYQKPFKLENLPYPFNCPDMVVFHNTYYVHFLTISKKLLRKRIPYIIIPHGALTVTAQQKKWFKKVIANFLLFNRFFSSAVAIQFLSEREMNASKYNEKGFIGTNGMDIPSVCASNKQRKEIKMLYIGRIEVHIKGIDMMLEAVSECRKLFKDYSIKLNLYGPDCHEGHAYIQAMISKYNIEDYVTIQDAVIGKEKEKILLDSDIFIQTSRTEGMPLGILEALSYGIPCIVTEGTGLGEIIKKYQAGWVAKTTTQSIIETIKKAVIEKSFWNQKSEQARNLIKENYIWDKVVNVTLEEYKRRIL